MLVRHFISLDELLEVSLLEMLYFPDFLIISALMLSVELALSSVFLGEFWQG